MVEGELSCSDLIKGASWAALLAFVLTIAFARALVNSPKIILADEPTANLDSENRDMVVSLLRQAVKEQEGCQRHHRDPR